MSTIYEQIGGTAALEIVVEDFYARVLADQELAGFFSGTNMSRLKGRQVELYEEALEALYDAVAAQIPVGGYRLPPLDSVDGTARHIMSGSPEKGSLAAIIGLWHGSGSGP
jgi:hypothetical protein